MTVIKPVGRTINNVDPLPGTCRAVADSPAKNIVIRQNTTYSGELV